MSGKVKKDKGTKGRVTDIAEVFKAVEEIKTQIEAVENCFGERLDKLCKDLKRPLDETINRKLSERHESIQFDLNQMADELSKPLNQNNSG